MSTKILTCSAAAYKEWLLPNRTSVQQSSKGANAQRAMKDYLLTLVTNSFMGFTLKANLDTCGLMNSSNCHIQILKYDKKGYLQQHLEIPDNAELCKKVFLSQPKAHQVK